LEAERNGKRRKSGKLSWRARRSLRVKLKSSAKLAKKGTALEKAKKHQAKAGKSKRNEANARRRRRKTKKRPTSQEQASKLGRED